MAFKPKNILWPTDFSSRSIKGAQCALAMCKTFKAKLHVVHITPVLTWGPSSAPVMSGGDMLITTTDVVTPAKEALAELIAKQFPGLHQIAMHVKTGNAWYEICLYAQIHNIDMIVMATHGRTGAKRLFFGSTAERVVRHATCPVLTVKSFAQVFSRDADQEQPEIKSPRRVARRSAPARGRRQHTRR